MTILQVQGLTKAFGGVEALSDIDLQVNAGDVVGVIGPNGAGKSTLFNVLSGVMRPTRGKVRFQDKDITGLKPHRIAARGLVRTFQGTELFSDLSVTDNVRVACALPARVNLLADVIGLPSVTRKETDMKRRAAEIVELTGLQDVRHKLARDLPHGHQRALGVGIALATGPQLLCLDEPVTGMNMEETEAMIALIDRIHQQNVTILLVEHHMKVVMTVCQRIVVLNFGKKIAEGGVDEIQGNQDVIEAYLGRPEDDVA
jgi:branched-chain amino acid transport system ATP-binding protein